MARLLADDLVSSDAERACLKALREATRMADGPMERHCLRVFVIAERLASEDGRRIDREVLLCASLLHDIGAYGVGPGTEAYTIEGGEFALELLERFGWSEIRARACASAIEHHHRLEPVWELGPETEVVRRADVIDVTGGVVAFGLSRGWLRGLFRAVPRDGFYGEIARLTARIARERPDTAPAIFGLGED